VTNDSFKFNTGISDEEPQNNQNHPGKLFLVLMLTSFFFKGTNHAVLLFLFPHFSFFCTSLPMTLFPFVFARLLLSSHLFFIQPQTLHATRPPPLLLYQSAKWGFTARCWSLRPAVNVPRTVWPGRREPPPAVVRKDGIRSTLTLPIWPAHVRIKPLYICTCLSLIYLFFWT